MYSRGGEKGVFIPDFYGAWVFCFHGTPLGTRGVDVLRRRGIKGDLNLRENPCIADNLFVVMAYCSFISLIAEVPALTLGELLTDVSFANGRISEV